MNSGNLNKLNVILVINSTDKVNSKWINFEFREEVFAKILHPLEDAHN